MRRKKKSRGKEEVELNLAAMLDMAFQLLAFFILTFRPSPSRRPNHAAHATTAVDHAYGWRPGSR